MNADLERMNGNKRKKKPAVVVIGQSSDAIKSRQLTAKRLSDRSSQLPSRKDAR